MIGAIINSAGIVAGGVCAVAIKKPLPNRFQAVAQTFLGASTVLCGLRLTWRNLNGSAGQMLKELGIVLLAMALGKLVGRLLGLQTLSNSVGQYATRAMNATVKKKEFGEGFLLATALFCAGPLSILASVQEGLNDFSPVFLVKAGTDGLATVAFCLTFGWGALVSAIPVLAFQMLLIRGAQWLKPMLDSQPWPLIDAVNITDGLLIFCVALLILEARKVRVAEYLPSLVIAPLLMRWLW